MSAILAEKCHFFYHPQDRLRLTIGESKSYLSVVPSWAAPLSLPNKYLSILDSAGKEILMFPSLDDVPFESRAAVQEELRRRYLTSIIKRVISAKAEFGVSYWQIETDRGIHDFVAQSLQENAQWLTPTQLLIVDIDANRFEVPDVSALDEHSQKLIRTIV